MKDLKIFVEGEYDEIFFGVNNGKHIDSTLKSLILQKYRSIKVIPYAKKDMNKVCSLIKSYSPENIDYIYLADSDNQNGNQICPLHKKKKILDNDTDNCLNENQIWIAKAEIESWFYAGATNINKFKIPNNTESSIAEKFENEMKFYLEDEKGIKKIKSRHHQNFLLEISRLYNIDDAMKRNKSFESFLYHFGFKPKLIAKDWKGAEGMLKAGNDINLIMSKTNLSKTEIEELKNK